MWRAAQRGRAVVLGSAVLAVALVGACGGSDDDTSATTTMAAADETTTTTAERTTTTADAAAADLWAANAVEHRGRDGTEVAYECPPGGTLDAVWGTETYSDDSSVCTAAVHVGLVTVDEGGTVTIEIQPGEASYEAGEANGVTSAYYGAYQGSFTFPDAPPGSGEFEVPAASWAQTAAALQVGDSRTLACSAGGSLGSLWGTGVYTADSSICTAAVHDGRITVDDGGTVVVVVIEGRDAYEGSSANGVTSTDFGVYDRSFELPEDQTG